MHEAVTSVSSDDDGSGAWGSGSDDGSSGSDDVEAGATAGEEGRVAARRSSSKKDLRLDVSHEATCSTRYACQARKSIGIGSIIRKYMDTI